MFSIEPDPVNDIDEWHFGASIPDYTEEEKQNNILTQIKDNINLLNLNQKKFNRESRKYKNWLGVGFGLQAIAIILSFFYN
jgi:hypothetical protein